MIDDLDPAAVTGTSNEAVIKATGKPWAEWMELLDMVGGRQMTHKQLVAHLAEHYAVSPWWQQQLTVGYEQSRRLREKHEMSEGYQVSRSRTIAAGAGQLYNAWLDDDVRSRWLPDTAFSVRKVTPPRIIRLTWSDDSHVEVRLAEKESGKTSVTVQQNKLPDADSAERMKAYWAAALERLQGLVDLTAQP